MDDLALVEQARSGDTSAFYTLVRRYERSVYWTVFALLGNSADAEETTQEAFLKCFLNLAQFRGEAKFSTWLIQIAVNEAKQRLRKNPAGRYEPLERAHSGGDEEPPEPRDLADWRDNPEERYAEEELRRIVHRAVDSLPAPYRVVLVLRDLQQMSNEEVAAALGLSLPATKSRLLRARLQLREKLAPYFRRSPIGSARGWWGRLAGIGKRGR